MCGAAVESLKLELGGTYTVITFSLALLNNNSVQDS